MAKEAPHCNISSHIDSLLVRQLFSASQTVNGEFTTSRVFELAGEKMGETIVTDKIESKEDLTKAITNYFKAKAIGKLTFTKTNKEQGAIRVEYNAKLEGGVFKNTPNIQKTCCFLEAGIIKGAFIKYTGLLNTQVKEIKCYGLGNGPCEFEVRILPI